MMEVTTIPKRLFFNFVPTRPLFLPPEMEAPLSKAEEKAGKASKRDRERPFRRERKF